MSKLELKSIYKKYDNAENYSVTDFNLKIEDKEFIVFVGPSGCGKSTTLRMIAGLEEITEGDLIINDQRVNDVAPKNRDIAMVFQNYALYPHMSVFDNMAFGLKLRKIDKKEIEQKVHYAADVLGLTEYLDRKPAALSGGQRQRVALGRAIVRNAGIFLMDEPLSNLDAKLRMSMRTEIARLHQELGSTTIYVTHDQTEALTMATRIVVMNDGYIQQIGTPQEVYDYPVNMFVASFIGTPPMNFFKGNYQQGKIHLDNGIVLIVTEAQKRLLDQKQYDGKNIMFGIRPEDINSEQIALDMAGESVFRATVEVSEMLGSETLLYLKIGADQFVAKVDKRDYHAPGETVELAFDMPKATFFDIDTQEAIRYD